MTDDRTTTTTNEGQPHTTVVERRGSGAGILIGLAVLILVIVGAVFLLNQSQNDALKTDAQVEALDSVGDAADSVGDAAQSAGDAAGDAAESATE